MTQEENRLTRGEIKSAARFSANFCSKNLARTRERFSCLHAPVSKAIANQATPGGGSAPREHVPSGVNPVSSALLPVVLCIVAVLAQQFQVVMVQSDAWDGDILRREINLVMDDLPGADQAAGEAALTQAVALGYVAVPAGDPGSRSVECFCKIFCHENKKMTNMSD